MSQSACWCWRASRTGIRNFSCARWSWIAQHGGSLGCYRGAPTSQVTEKLGRLLRVRWSQTAEPRFRVRLTEPGRGMNWWPTRGSAVGDVLTALPALVRSEHVEQTKP